MEAQKKAWEKPQLIVLARGTPAEVLENNCKEITPTFSGDIINSQDGCNRNATGNCGACQGRSGGAS